MNTVIVWVLIIVGSPKAGVTLMIDNLPNQAECERVQKSIADERPLLDTICIQTRRLK